jgi:hypothetical protein
MKIGSEKGVNDVDAKGRCFKGKSKVFLRGRDRNQSKETMFQSAGTSKAGGTSQNHHHSILGFLFFTGCGVVSWSSKKQPIVTLSSTEAEYVALTHTTKDAIWH